MIWGLCLLCVAAGLRPVVAGPIPKSTKVEDTAASQEEVNILMFGVMQLRDSTNSVYETTEKKIDKITRALRSHEGTLRELERETEQAAQVKKQMKIAIQLLQEQMARQKAVTMQTRDWLGGVEQEEVELKTKVRKLEMYLINAVPGSLRELQERAEQHSNILKSLQRLTQFHKENIQTQNEQLSKLQKMSEVMT